MTLTGTDVIGIEAGELRSGLRRNGVLRRPRLVDDGVLNIVGVKARLVYQLS